MTLKNRDWLKSDDFGAISTHFNNFLLGRNQKYIVTRLIKQIVPYRLIPVIEVA